MATTGVAGVAGKCLPSFSAEHGGVTESAISKVKRHPFVAVIAGLTIGLVALAITDRITRKW